MCQSYREECFCGHQTTEIFFGRMILDENSVAQVYCPECSSGREKDEKCRVWDNGWLLELNLEVVRPQAPVTGLVPEEVTAERIFDEGFVTWVGLRPKNPNSGRKSGQKFNNWRPPISGPNYRP